MVMVPVSVPNWRTPVLLIVSVPVILMPVPAVIAATPVPVKVRVPPASIEPPEPRVIVFWPRVPPKLPTLTMPVL